jgi:hypothetical protein
MEEKLDIGKLLKEVDQDLRKTNMMDRIFRIKK